MIISLARLFHRDRSESLEFCGPCWDRRDILNWRDSTVHCFHYSGGALSYLCAQ